MKDIQQYNFYRIPFISQYKVPLKVRLPFEAMDQSLKGAVYYAVQGGSKV